MLLTILKKQRSVDNEKRVVHFTDQGRDEHLAPPL